MCEQLVVKLLIFFWSDKKRKIDQKHELQLQVVHLVDRNASNTSIELVREETIIVKLGCSHHARPQTHCTPVRCQNYTMDTIRIQDKLLIS